MKEPKIEKSILWESWLDIPLELRHKFEEEIKQNNEMLERGEIESVEITDFMEEQNRKCPFCENEIDVTPCRMCGDYPVVNRNRQIVCCNVECDNYNEPYPVNEWLGIE